MGAVFDQLEEIRKQIAADQGVLSEAIERRDAVLEVARRLHGAARTYTAGSVAHRTVNHPVADADCGVVLDRRSYPELGPDGGGEGPGDIVDELVDLVREGIVDDYPDATVDTHKRGLLVRFDEPMKEQDPTVDLIVTLTRKDADGLWIPNLETGKWDASHPEKHTELFTSGSKELRVLRARTIRFAKAWNCQWEKGDRALSSFNISALAHEFVTDEEMPIEEAIAGWFGYATTELRRGRRRTPPASRPTSRSSSTRSTVTTRLEKAAGNLDDALAHDDDPDAVAELLGRVFPTTRRRRAVQGRLRPRAPLRQRPHLGDEDRRGRPRHHRAQAQDDAALTEARTAARGHPGFRSSGGRVTATASCSTSTAAHAFRPGTPAATAASTPASSRCPTTAPTTSGSCSRPGRRTSRTSTSTTRRLHRTATTTAASVCGTRSTRARSAGCARTACFASSATSAPTSSANTGGTRRRSGSDLKSGTP